MKKSTRLMGALLAGVMAFTGVPEAIMDQPVSIVAEAASTKLAAPKNIKAEVNSTQIKLSWTKVKGASAYRVYMLNTKTKKYAEYKNVSGKSCVVNGLKAGTTYKFKIVALVKKNGTYVLQTPTKGISVKTKLAAPKTVKAAVSGTTVKLAWSKVTGAKGYALYEYNTSTKKFKYVKAVSGTSVTLKNVANGKHWYRIAALVKTNGKLTPQIKSSVVAVTATNIVAAKEHVSGYRYGTTIYPIKHDIEYMKKLNSDFIGWLQIKDTPIDLPIVQASNNTFYLYHTFYGQDDPTKVGTSFADYHVPVTANSRPDNLIIYGHNIHTGVGLAKVTNYYPARYGSLKFYLTHPTFTYESAYGGQSTYVVFAGMFVNTDTKQGAVFNYHKFRNFTSESMFYKYFEQVFDRSVFYNPDLDIKYGDKFLTLSTCYYPYGEVIDTRFVLFARELRKGETTISTKNAYINKSPLYFDYYYKVSGGKWAGRKWPDSLMQGYTAWKKKNS